MANAPYEPRDEVLKQLAINFTYHAPKGDQAERYTALRDLVGTVASAFVHACPPSRELSLALTKLEEATFWANASIARNE